MCSFFQFGMRCAIGQGDQTNKKELFGYVAKGQLTYFELQDDRI